MTQALIIFIKNPLPGKCKTRLAKDIGDDKALQVYRDLLAITRKACDPLSCSRYLYYDSFIDTEDDWSNELYTKRLQASGDLGNRMIHAFEEVLEEHDSAIIIGSDCPELNSGILSEAFNLLSAKDFVLGPSLDGGYYMLGMKEMHSFIFEDISWSTGEVFDQTIKKITEKKLSFSETEKLNDIDTLEDLKKFPQINYT